MIWKKLKYDAILILAIVVSLVISVFRYAVSLYRTIESVKDLCNSLAYYFCSVFGADYSVTVTELPDWDYIISLLPYSATEVVRKFEDMWQYVFDSDCFISYLENTVNNINDFSLILLVLLPLLIFLPLIIRSLILISNTDKHNKKSRSVVFWEKNVLPVFAWIKQFCLGLYARFLECRFYFWSLIIIWLINFNVITIAFEFFAYYFYFCFSLDFVNVSVQLTKLLLDLIILFSGAPLLFWLIVVYVVICIMRKKIGYSRLNHREKMDRVFIDSQPLIMMFTGTMGTGKTTALTSCGISSEIMFRDKALELMLMIDSRYPNFPWIKLEDWILRCVRHKRIFNLTTCRDCVNTRKKSFQRSQRKKKLFGYDFEKYKYFHNDNLTFDDIWKSIEDYACLYFIYTIESSLIVSNYSVRTDGELSSLGNFPMWNSDLFQRSPVDSDRGSRRSHILDYDILRLGMQVLKDNPRRASFEFGVLLMSEFAKERGNQLTLQGIKKDDPNANQKNDLFSYDLKMCRHKATICGYPFVRFMADEQRSDSLNADTRELMSVVHIDKKQPKELLMPLFFVEELIYDIFYEKFVEFYKEYRYNRGDTCLAMYLMHNIMSAYNNYYRRIYNTFGCSVLDLSVELEGVEPLKANIHLLDKKVYSDRFSTDCYRGYFEPELRVAKYGLDDYEEYADGVATLDELHHQNSYFIRDLENLNLGDEN